MRNVDAHAHTFPKRKKGNGFFTRSLSKTIGFPMIDKDPQMMR